MCVLLVPLTMLCVALSVPAMSVLAFGQADAGDGVELLAASLASLGLGLLPYGAFFLLARAWYVLGDSRTPAIVGGAGALIGVAIMAAAAVFSTGTSTIFWLGVAHSVAFLFGTCALFVALRRRIGEWVLPALLLPTSAVAAVIGVGVWFAYDAWSPQSRGLDLVALLVLVPVSLGLYLG